MSRVKLNIIGLSTGQTSGSYTLILAEDQGSRKLPIIIGSFEAQAIAIEIEKIVPFRPMTHDLFLNFCKSFNIIIHEVIIYNLHEGVFHAKLVCEQDGEIREIDARTSDSIALAVRFKCPIYTYEDIMDAASVIFNEEIVEEDDSPQVSKKAYADPNDMGKMNLEQLHKKLDESLKIEDYSLAARIRDEINKGKVHKQINMERFSGILGILLILALSFLLSNNRKAINYRIVLSGLTLQLMLALFILKTDIGKNIFEWMGEKISQLLMLADKGGEFVFGGLMRPELLKPIFGDQYSFLFMFKIIPTIIFIVVLVNIAYHIGLMQIIISFFARIVHVLMGVSGSEALSNVASTFVGQVEAQIMIRHYINTMTMSELLASMSGSMACIAGGVMAVYISMGVPAPYLLAASIMAAPGALVISKIVWPETKESFTKGVVKVEVKKIHTNLLDAISHGASDGLKISLNVIAILIGFIALVALIDLLLLKTGILLAGNGISLAAIGIDLNKLSLDTILGSMFSIFAWTMGVPSQDVFTVGSLMGTKIATNEFVAYSKLSPMIHAHTLHPKSLIIASFALCGFANFGSIAIQLGGIGELAPQRRSDLAKLGFKALICGTLASYLSATLAGIML